MKILRQLFSKKRPVESFADKVEMLDTQPHSTLEALVMGTAGDSEDIAIRKEALKRLPYTLAICDVMNSGPSSLEKTAREHIAVLLNKNEVSVGQLVQDINETESLLAIAALSKNDELQSTVLSKINDQNTLASICENSHSAVVRQTLAERIDQPELLRGLLKSLKNKDKNAYKIVKAKVDEIKAEEDAQERIALEIVAVCKEAELHSKRAIDKDYSSKLQRLLTRWEDVEAQADEGRKNQFSSAVTLCRQRESLKESELEALANLEANMSEADTNRKAVIQEFWALMNSVLAWPNFDESKKSEVQQQIAELKEKWKELRQFGSVMDAHLKQFTQASEGIENQLLQFEEKGTLVEVFERVKHAEAPEKTDISYLNNLTQPLKKYVGFTPGDILGDVQKLLKEIKDKEKQAHEERQKHIRIIGGLIRKSSIAVDKGRLKQAIGIRHSIDEKLEELAGTPQNLQSQLESLDENIQKLVDWQAYAVVPKKEALIVAMEQLVGAEIPPEALATKIKKLQDEWKSLSQSGKDRKEDLWEKFSELADKAFEPCKVYYQELSEIRQQNLGKRQALVEQLTQYYQQNDWENADWRQVEKVLRTARQELHSHAPVDRAANKPVLDAFDKVMTDIQTKLEAEFEKNRNAKQQIISQAEKLGEVGDMQQAIDSAKRLQSQWKRIGRCAYKENERLWKEFRVHCDAVFDKREKIESAQQAELDNNLAVAQAFIDKMQALTKLTGEELLAARAEKDQIRQDFAEVGELHPSAEKGTQRAFNNAVEAFDRQVDKTLAEAETQAWSHTFEAAEKINAYGLAQLQGDDSAALLEEAQSYVDEVSRWPEGAHSVIKEKFDNEANANIEDNIKALRMLCIRAEIIGDVESPTEDKSDRMAYQVELLQQGMSGTAALVNEGGGSGLALEWVAVGPVPKEDYAALFSRFQQTWKKLI